MKLVTTEAVLTALCQHCDSHIEMCEECGMKEIVENVPSAWIKCSERLPEPRFAREWYLVALESGCVKSLAFEKAENRWHETGSPVTHWMPLPDAPEVDE